TSTGTPSSSAMTGGTRKSGAAPTITRSVIGPPDGSASPGAASPGAVAGPGAPGTVSTPARARTVTSTTVGSTAATTVGSHERPGRRAAAGGGGTACGRGGGVPGGAQAAGAAAATGGASRGPAGATSTPDSTSRAAATSSAAVRYRCAGSLAMPRAMTASNASGRPARTALGRGGGWYRCPATCAAYPEPGYGLAPVSTSCSTQASE